MLTVLAWLWQQDGGRASYTAENVNIWASMVDRHLTMPHRIACVTRHTEGLDGGIDVICPPGDFEDVRIGTWPEHMPQCLRRIAMFRPDAAEIFGERFVSMDLDCVIGGPLDPLFDRPEDIVLYRGTNGKRPYNGSALMMTAGARPQVYTRFTPLAAAQAGQQFLGSDQAWVSHVLGPGEATWGTEDGVHVWGSRKNVGKPRVMFFLGNPKPWDREPQQNAWVAWNYKVKK